MAKIDLQLGTDDRHRFVRNLQRADPLQTEAYLADLIATARVTETGGIQRIDARYVNGKLCFPSNYYHYCKKFPEEAKRLAEMNVTVCPE